MSRIDVHEGDKLDKGAKLGLTGASGRVTGPHLHLGVRWNGVWVDPVQLVGLTLPKPAQKQSGPPRPTAPLDESGSSSVCARRAVGAGLEARVKAF